MPKNVLIPAPYGGGLTPPVAEQSIRFDRTRATNLNGYAPADALGSDLFEVSCWIKITGDNGLTRVLWEAFIDANNFTHLALVGAGNNERLRFEAQIGGAIRAQFTTGGIIRDTSAWYHNSVQFSRTTGQLDLYINGELYTKYDTIGAIAPTIDNVGGYAWQSNLANHFIGSDNTNTQGFSGVMAEFYTTGGSIQGISYWGQFNSVGTWEHKFPLVLPSPNARDVYLTFGRTADLGEDFSGNANDFPNHVNGGPTDQLDDWMERNYCTFDVNNSGTLGFAVTEAGLVSSSSGRVTMQPGPNTGVWYYEKNGVGITWDTGVSGRFDPLLLAGSYNFGQLPFVGVGPGVGELTLCSPNMPASDVPHSRLGFHASEYDGNATSPRTVIGGDYGLSEHDDILITDIALAVLKNISGAFGNLQTNALRVPASLFTDTTAAEVAAATNGYVNQFLSTAIEVIDGATNGENVNGAGNLISMMLWGGSKFAQNLIIVIDEDDAEEFLIDGDTDVGSSDLELGSEDGSPGSAEQAVGMRWLNLRIEQGATINSAYIQFECDTVRTDQPNDLEIWCEDIDDAPTFVGGGANFNITGRTKTSASVLWSPPQWTGTQDRLAAQRTPDISVPVKEVVDRGGWAPGNDLVAIIEPESGGTVGRSEAEAYDAVGGDPDRNTAMLQVAWDNGTLDTGLSVFEYFGVGKVAEMLHGLDAVPEFFVVKRLDATADWRAYHSLIQTGLAAPEDGHLTFNNNAAAVTSSSSWNNTPPDAEFVTLGNSNAVNAHEGEYAGWAMREIEGFSRLFRYVGTGGSAGPSIYCGFKPRMVIIKRADGVGDWFLNHRGNFGASLLDDAGVFNDMAQNGYLNTNAAWLNDDNIAVYANGFRITDSTAAINTLNGEYVGMAFAEVPYQLAKAAR
jgi:hypothetical protein